MYAEDERRRKRRGRAIGGIVFFVAVVLLLAVVFYLPIPHDFFGTVTTSQVGPATYSGSAEVSFPSGSSVDLTWRSTSGYPMSVTVGTPSSTQCAWEDSISESCSFHASSGEYEIEVTDSASSSETSEVVSYSGTYALPLLSV